jgi:hypothetical protein
MPQYELVLEGFLSDHTIADLLGFVVDVLEAFATLGLGLQRLSRVQPSAE